MNALGKLLRAIGRGTAAAVPAVETPPPAGPGSDRRRHAVKLLDRLTADLHPGDQVGDYEYLVAAGRWLADVERDALVEGIAQALALGWRVDELYAVLKRWDSDEARTVYTLIRDRLADRCPGAFTAGGHRP